MRFGHLMKSLKDVQLTRQMASSQERKERRVMFLSTFGLGLETTTVPDFVSISGC